METTEQLWDVVIVEISSRKVESIGGHEMHLDSGHSNAVRCYETISPRLNDYFIPAIVPANKYQKGSVVAQEDIDNQP